MNIVNGNRVWRNSTGQFHREDGPAIEWANGDKEWWVNGPVVEMANGDKAWWVHGNLHRTNGPVVEYADGGRKWYFRNKKVSRSKMETYVCQKDLKVLLLARAINPFCEINVAKYTL